MRIDAPPPLTLIGPRALYRFAYFAARYAGAAFFAGLLVLTIAFIKSALGLLGIVGGLVLALGVMLAGFLFLAFFRFILLEINHFHFAVRKGYINLKVKQGNVVVTSARDVHLGEDVILACHNGVITIHGSHGDQREIRLSDVTSLTFDACATSGVNNAQDLTIMKLLSQKGEVFEFRLSIEAVSVWRDLLISVLDYGSATAG
jgi:hypothetical protein